MFKIKNILVPTDFSKGFMNTLNYAVEFAKSMKSVLHIIHVIEPIIFSFDIVIAKYDLGELSNELEAFAKKDLDKISKLLLKKEIRFSAHVLHGSAHEEILNYADKNNIDMICMAVNRNGNLENLLFGSIAEKVLRKANCPVLAVRSKEKAE